jgi:hypothetical protein
LVAATFSGTAVLSMTTGREASRMLFGQSRDAAETTTRRGASPLGQAFGAGCASLAALLLAGYDRPAARVSRKTTASWIRG